eukprot:4376390-Pyramimonas_sp.AAC.1
MPSATSVAQRSTSPMPSPTTVGREARARRHQLQCWGWSPRARRAGSGARRAGSGVRGAAV